MQRAVDATRLELENHRSYGNSCLDGNSRAVFGDVSQDVNITGDVHLHLHTPLPGLEVADAITRFFHNCERLRDAGRALINYTQASHDEHAYILNHGLSRCTLAIRQETMLRTWVKAAHDLPPNLDLINRETAFTAKEPRSESLQVLLDSVHRDGFRLAKDIKELEDELNYLLPMVQARANVFKPADRTEGFALRMMTRLARNTRFVGRNTNRECPSQVKRLAPLRSVQDEVRAQKSSVKALVLEETLLGIRNAEASINNLLTTRSEINTAYGTFTREWTDRRIDQRLSQILLHNSQLRPQLSALVNPQRDVQERIVEILSINRSAQVGLSHLAAIITRGDGSREAVTMAKPLGTSVPVYENADMIRYDLTNDGRTQQTTQPLVQATPDFVHKILSALFFREEAERRVQVKEAHNKTFQWILDEDGTEQASHFPSWVRKEGKMFFVNGKPGSGKSTLMKYIHQQDRFHALLKEWSHGRQLVCGSFFFWYAGKSLQKSYEGLLRSLLYQLLKKRPDLTPLLFPNLSYHFLSSPEAELNEIPLFELQGAMSLLARDMPEDLAIFFMIDGVDEYSGDQYEFAKFLNEIVVCPWIKILVSSRPTSTSFQILSQFPSIKVQDLTANDIRAYVDEELINTTLMRDRDCIEDGLADTIRETLISKSSGVFLWIVIVVKKLLLGLDAFDEVENLMATIDDLPAELDQLYDLLFRRMTKQEQREGSLLLQLIFHARETQITPSTALQLMEAIKGYTKINLTAVPEVYNRSKEFKCAEMLDRKLRHRCCGLVEVVFQVDGKSIDEPRVEFLHRTVHDFLRQESVQQTLRASYEANRRTMNLNLLASSLCMILRRTKHQLPLRSAQDCTKMYFAACLSYSEALNSVGDQTFTSFMARAEYSYMNACRTMSSEKSMGLYEEGYYIYTATQELDRVDIPKVLTHGLDLETFAALLCASIGSAAYFESKLKTHPETKSLLLLCLLTYRNPRSHVSDTMSEHHIGKIKLLLDSGTDPVTPALRSIHLDAGHGYERWQLVRSMSRVAAITPWNYWLAAFMLDHRWLDIAVLLVDSCMDMSATLQNEKQEEVIRDIRLALMEYLTTSKAVANHREVESTNESTSASASEAAFNRKQREEGMVANCRKVLSRLSSNDERSTGKRMNSESPPGAQPKRSRDEQS